MAKKDNNLKKGRLSNKDFETFKKNIHMSNEELAKKLKRSVSFIEKTRKRVYPNKKTGKWNKADTETLKENMENMSVEELARLLNRTENAIKNKLKSVKPKEKVEEKVEEKVDELKNNELTDMEIKDYIGRINLADSVEQVNDIISELKSIDAKEEGSIVVTANSRIDYLNSLTTVEEDCCGQNCCDHENKGKQEEEQISGWKRFWRSVANFFKIW